MSESDAILVASLDAATSLEEKGLAARALVHLADERLNSDPRVNPSEVMPVAEQAVRTFEQLGDPLGLAEAEALLGNALSREGRTDESFAAVYRALAYAEAAGNEVVRRDIIGRIAQRLCESSIPAGEAIERMDELRASARNDPVLDAALVRCLALLLTMTGRFDEALEHIRVTDHVLDGADQTVLSLASRRFVAEAKNLAGDPAGAKEDLLVAFLSMRDARGHGAEARALRAAADLALLCCDQGDWDGVAEYLSYGRHVDDAEPVEGKVYTVFRLAARARFAAVRGDHAAALELAERAVEVAERGTG
jgi:tetratricopeptide (TPR) repeat protein